MLYELLYTSEASWELSQKELLELLRQARNKNRQSEITGLLLYHKKEFMQLIEGEKEEILKLWQTIKVDERHFFAKVIYHEPVDNRGFSEWNMAFKNLDGIVPSNLDGFSELFVEGFASDFVTERPSTARNLMNIIKDYFFVSV